MNRKIIFAIVVLSAIALSLIECNLEKNGVIARSEDDRPTTYITLIWVETTEDSTLLMWESSTKGVRYYTIYRKLLGEKDWQYLHRIEASADPGYQYRFRDESTAPDLWYYQYNVVATTGNGDVECNMMNIPTRVQ